MNLMTKNPVKNKKVIAGVKIIVCVFIFVWLMNNLFIDGMDDYISYKVYYYQSESEDCFPAVGASCIEQTFYAQSSVLSNIKLYLCEPSDSEIIIQMIDDTRKILMQETVNLRDFTAHEWNKISIDCSNLKKNGQYTILLKGKELSGILLSASNTYPEIFADCMVDGAEIENTLAVGLQFTDWYMLLGHGLDLAVNVLYIFIIAFALCFSVLHLETLFDVFTKSEKKKGFFYAIYFSVYTVLLFNPLGSVRNKVTEFGRILGAGLNAGVDVSKRISNFNHWFICFAIAFCLFYMLANYFKNKGWIGENKKAMELLDNVIVIANVILGLKCITYFYNKSHKTAIFNYSDYFINLIILLLIAYMLLHLENKISLEKMEALLLSGWSLTLPMAIVITHDWTDGRVFIGLQVFLSVLVVLGVKYLKIDWDCAWISGGLNICTVFLSLIPFCTSFYIEFVTLLNQHEIFWIHLRRNYFGAVVFGILIMIVFAFVLLKREKTIENWKKFSYPALVLGFSCLCAQIPVYSTYNVDMMETANSSILISDFLYYGEIPIVQHYGGHMMSAVWEGILYAVLNNDYTGAVFSPYAGYLIVAIAILFYSLIKYVWDEDAAVLTVLFFPFYSSMLYWGWGILMALAVMAYVKKNTYFRAMLFWFSFVWCALYRLDLGFAFGLACLVVLIIYIIADKNRLALKQLAITLVVWGIAGVALWFGICIAKDIHPLNRLLEFLMINLSNRNWAYTEIGDMSQAAFAWAYLFLPFLVAACMIYSVFSVKIRENLGTSVWMVNLVLGFSYFFNFSRGLVRHSLAEGQLRLVVWSAYVFLAVFIVAVTNQRKTLLPTYAALILLSSLFLSKSNYSESAIMDTAAGKIGSYTETWTHGRFAEEEEPELYWTKLQKDRQVINRVEWDEDLVKTVEDYAVMIDALLEDDETFVDCSNRTTLHSLLGRRDPVYVSQSPLQLSGQFTQEEFVKEIRNVPIVLMPYGSGGLDGILDSYRYYKVFEYIYTNYVPLCTYENKYAVWCLPERYDGMVTRVRNLKGVCNCRLLAYENDGIYRSEDERLYDNDLPGTLDLYSLEKLPVIWAENDRENSADNNVLATLEYEDGVYTYALSPTDYGTNGNYLKVGMIFAGGDWQGETGTDDETATAVIRIGKMVDGEFETKYSYSFTVEEGYHDYMFRISSNYNWYLGETNAVILESESPLYNIRMAVLEGD